jgi:AraC-like DNA-binding protein
VVYSEPIWIGQRLRNVAELDDGTITLWTDDAESCSSPKTSSGWHPMSGCQRRSTTGWHRPACSATILGARKSASLADQPLLPQDRLGHLSLQCFAPKQGSDLARGYPEAVPVQSERVRERHQHAASKSERRGRGAAGGRAENLSTANLCPRSRAPAHRTIADIAYAWGFSSASHVSHRFRETFGAHRQSIAGAGANGSRTRA